MPHPGLCTAAAIWKQSAGWSRKGKGLAICNPQFPIVSEKIVKIPMRNKNPWQLSVAIPLRPQSRIAERFFQIVQKAALPLNKKLPGRTSTSSPKAASAED